MDQPFQHDHPSLAYWDLDENRRVQRYYIALCLLMAALQDALLGRTEQTSKNLNWSATVSYYSLVHTGRLVVFTATGDFPTHHGPLRTLLSDPDRQVVLDWLQEFKKLEGVRPTQGPSTSFAEVAALLEAHSLEQLQERLARLGRTLRDGGKLRNDSNYEALLVAHEYQHPLVSRAFEHLSNALAASAEEGLRFAIDVFNAMRREAPASFGPAIEALSYKFLHGRLRPALETKIRGNTEAERVLSMAEDRLELDAHARPDARLEERLDMLFFEGKTRLMDRFRQRIMTLERTIGTYDAERWEGWSQMPEGYPEWRGPV